VAATATLSLATYNTVQISKLETAIEAQEAKTDLLTDIANLHEQHLHQLHGLIDGIGKELQVVKLQQTFQVRVDRIVAQISSDDSKLRAVIATFERIIITAFNKKLAPGALSTDVLNQIIYHINDIASRNNYNKFVHEPANLYNLEVSFIHRPEEHTIILLLNVPFVEADHLLTLYEFCVAAHSLQLQLKHFRHAGGRLGRPPRHRGHQLIPDVVLIGPRKLPTLGHHFLL